MLQEVEGEIFAYDKSTNCLVLVQPGSTPFHHNLRMLKTSYVKAVLSAVPPGSPPSTQLPFVDMQRCREREEKAIRVRLGPQELPLGSFALPASAAGQPVLP